jgi:hypothetical protein
MIALLTGVGGRRALPEPMRERMATRLVGQAAPRQHRHWLLRPARTKAVAGIAAAVVIAAGVSGLLLSAGGGGSRSKSSAARPGIEQPTRPPPAAAAYPGISSGGFAARQGPTPAGSTGSADYAQASPAASDATPALYAVSPTSGPASGGTWVTISGANFSGTTNVRFGDIDAAQFVVVSDQEVQAVAPGHMPGTVDVVVVVNPRGSTLASPADRFLYTG